MWNFFKFFIPHLRKIFLIDSSILLSCLFFWTFFLLIHFLTVTALTLSFILSSISQIILVLLFFLSLPLIPFPLILLFFNNPYDVSEVLSVHYLHSLKVFSIDLTFTPFQYRVKGFQNFLQVLPFHIDFEHTEYSFKISFSSSCIFHASFCIFSSDLWKIIINRLFWFWLWRDLVQTNFFDSLHSVLLALFFNIIVDHVYVLFLLSFFMINDFHQYRFIFTVVILIWGQTSLRPLLSNFFISLFFCFLFKIFLLSFQVPQHLLSQFIKFLHDDIVDIFNFLLDLIRFFSDSIDPSHLIFPSLHCHTFLLNHLLDIFIQLLL